MINFILISLTVVFLLWVLFRLLAWSVIRLVWRVAHIEVKIQTIGFFTFSNVHCKIRDRVTVKIEKLWLTSCYFSSEARKPLSLCLGDVRVEAELTTDEVTSGPQSASKIPSLTPQTGQMGQGGQPFIISVLKMLGLKIDNLNVILLRGPVTDCIFHITVQEVTTDVHAGLERVQMLFYLDSFSLKMLKTSQDGKDPPCLLEASFTHHLDVEMSGRELRPEAITFTLIRPHVKITEGLFMHLQERGTTKRSAIRRAAAQKRSPNGRNVMKMIPQKLLLQIEETDIAIVKEVAQRNLNIGFKSASAGFEHQGLHEESPNGKAELTIKDFSVNSSKANLSTLSLFNICAQASDQSVSITTKLHNGFFGYHQEEIQYWVTMLSRVKLKDMSPDPPIPAYRSSQQECQEETSSSLKYLCNRALNLSVGMQSVSLAIAMATCPGLKAGVTEIKIAMNMIPVSQEETFCARARDIRGDLDVNILYVKLAEGGVATTILSSKHHHWNTLLYMGTLIVKSYKYGEQGSLESMLDSLQVEFSTKGLSVISQLVCAILKLRGTSVPRTEHLRPPHSLERQTSHSKNTFLNLANFTSNVQCTNINLYGCNEKKVFVMLRNDSIDIQHKYSEGSVTFQGIKVIYEPQTGQSHPLVRSHELHGYVGHLKNIKVIFNLEEQITSVSLSEEISLVWTTTLHLCVFQTIWDLKELAANIRGPGIVEKKRKAVTSEKAQSKLNVSLGGNIQLSLHLQNNHKVAFTTPEILVDMKGSEVSVRVDQLNIACDQHDVFKLKGFQITSQHHCERLCIERTSLRTLKLPTNRAWSIEFEKFHIIFPNGYNFASCLEAVKNINKFRKVVHRMVKKPFTIDSPLPPDLIIKVKSFMVQISDDPFEVKLGDNYELLCDESYENEKRLAAMDKRIQELKKTHGLLPVSKVEELYASLSKKSAEVYIQRSRQLYTESPMRTRFWTWSFENVEILALADLTLHGRDNCVHHMTDIDPESPFPSDMEFVTLFCRMVNASCSHWMLQLRDFPQPLFECRDKHVWGRLVVAEQRGTERARRQCKVEVGAPWDDLEVERNMPALKFYHDFSCDMESLTMAYGPCMEPSWSQFNLWFNLINRPSVDPSRPMPFWDKMRLLLHGRLTMSVERMSWLYHCSLDPYNITEFMDWTWTKLVLDWTNAKWVLKGNLDIYAKTASKYDDCRLLHLPDLRFCVRLEWLCHGDPNDHHSVQPCAPNKVPEYSMEEHDSFRAFRSQKFNMMISFDTHPSESQDIPSCLFYSSTLRWMDKIKMCMTRVSRPIRRGKYWKMTKPKKPQLTRHVRNMRLSFNVPEFLVCYWVSFSKQNGVEMKSDAVNLDVGMQLHLATIDDGLKHRAQTDWRIKDFSAQLNNANIMLCYTPEKKSSSKSTHADHAEKNYFLSVDKVTYQRAEEKAALPSGEGIALSQEVLDTDDQPTHKVQVYSLKAAWTPLNRNVAISLYDGYTRATSIKKNLSAEALKGFKVDSSKTPLKQRAASIVSLSSAQATPSPLTKIQSGPAYSMLQKLVAETDSKFVAIHEESSSGPQVEQLHGRAACQTNDVVTKKWHVELYNSQAMLRGCETLGYVIVSAAKASLLACDHRPVWRDRQLKSKSTLVGTIDCMQYYATVDCQSTSVKDPTLQNNWLNIDNIAVGNVGGQEDTQGIMEMLGSGQSVGGVVSDMVGFSGTERGEGFQLQRVISRCRCEFFYAGYGEVEPDTITELPPAPDDCDQDMMTREEGVDTFTLLHHDLNICTNSQQYLMILDIVNNLLLYVEPRKKEQTEKLQDMRFKLQLASNEDLRTPILHRQNNLRKLVAKVRSLERELYQVHKTMDEDPFNDELQGRQGDLKLSLEKCKKQVNAAQEELSMMVSCYKESQLLKEQQKTAKTKKEAPLVRRNEVCFKKAEWRMTEADGQIGIADLVITHFTYTKTNKEDDSGAHHLETGCVRVTNLLPDSPYRDLLTPQEGQVFSERQAMLRILCKFKAPVGGISIKEHFEVNVVPVVVQLTHRFYKAAMAFFFQEKEGTEDEEQDSDSDIDDTISVTSTTSATSNKSSKAKDKGDKVDRPPRRRRRRRRIYNLFSDVDNVDKMKERAAENNMFLYIKIPEVPLRISYKSEKEKHITNIHDFRFLLPVSEYHNQTWTWRDFAMALKNDCKKVIIGQAVKQKLHIKSRSFLGELPRAELQEEDEKAKLLFGSKLFGSSDKSSSRKNLFGKPPK